MLRLEKMQTTDSTKIQNTQVQFQFITLSKPKSHLFFFFVFIHFTAVMSKCILIFLLKVALQHISFIKNTGIKFILHKMC